MTTLTDFGSMCALLAERGVQHHRDDLQSAVEIPTRVRGEQLVGVIVWDPRANLLHVVQPLVFDVPEERYQDVAMALVYVNHALILPGFGLDPYNRRIYYRWVVPRSEDGTMEVTAFDRAIRATLETCRDFLLPLRAVVSGELGPDQVMAEATKLKGLPQAP